MRLLVVLRAPEVGAALLGTLALVGDDCIGETGVLGSAFSDGRLLDVWKSSSMTWLAPLWLLPRILFIAMLSSKLFPKLLLRLLGRGESLSM